ncbi:hypothetical protein [Shewanella seohaensis]|uniref:hypothetical protein n=1 Tax=Shewanella seohaensis TaxID=755175 RepID=UPI0035B8740F
MINKISKVLEKKVELGKEIKVDGYTLIFRSILYFITASWIAFYPAYLLLIHMKVEKFFSYDVFTHGLFGVKSFLFLVFILISVSSLYMWGFILCFRNAVISRSKSMWVLGVVFVFISLLFHILIFSNGLASGKPERIIWLSVLGLVFSVAISSYMANPLKTFVSNWVAPIAGIVISATIPVIYINVTSDIVKTGLENFGVGGGLEASVHKVAEGSIIKSGVLLLLTPSYVYLREGDSGYISITRTGDTYVSVQYKS